MDLRDALIPASVQEFKIDHERHHVSDIYGAGTTVNGRRHIRMVVELHPRNSEELNWLVQSMQENGNRIVVFPSGSPIMHPSERDQPHCPPKSKSHDADKPNSPDHW